jgi:uncharacterized protein
MPTRLIQLDQLPQSPWKNGGGSTRQLAIHPPEASLDNFAWRISCARVERGGPFSAFPGVDRSLALLDGAGLRLHLPGRTRRLHSGEPPLEFTGEEEVDAELLEGPVDDLNVMTRRGLWRHQLQHLQLSGTQAPNLGADLLFIHCQRGSLQVRMPATTLALAAGQGLLLEDEPPPAALHSDTTACLYIARFHRQS